MAHGRISVILGVQAGLGAISETCEGFKKGLIHHSAGSMTPKNRLSDAEIYGVLTQLASLDKLLRREQMDVDWLTFGGSPQMEMPILSRILDLQLEDKQIKLIEELEQHPQDALIYVPLDVVQPKQVEQLARLSMMCSRVRHVAFANVPRWNHAQLVALKENWEWIEPRHPNRVMTFAEEIIKLNGGLTRKDIEKLPSQLKVKEENPEPTIITRSSKMKELLALVDAVADSDSTILISGGSGTGKELIAQRIHAKSHRYNKNLVAVNCGAIPEELLESELFGHIKGAFTGAVANREGRFEAAEGGTLFLDEIAEMGPNLQVKLLRVLQSKRFEPVGSTKSLVANVRIIAATNKDLEAEVAAGRFREDLFYRLNVIPVHILNVCERKEDIHLLVDHFVKKFNQEKSRRVTGVTRASLRALVAYDWPGNVREIENLVERMVILKSSGMIDVLDFPEKYRRKSFSEIEYEDLMNQSRNNLAPAQQVLGSTIPTQSVLGGANSQSMLDEESGEEKMKFNGTFTKTSIEQSSPTGAQGQQSYAPETHGEIAPVATEGSMSIEQAIQMIADRVAFPAEGLDFNSVVDRFENILILRALERTGWNRNRAAGLLRLNRTTLVEKLKKKQLMPPVRYGDSVIEGNA